MYIVLGFKDTIPAASGLQRYKHNWRLSALFEEHCGYFCRLLANFGMTPFELGSVGSLMPGSVDEARALVQTLEVCLLRY